MHKLFFEQQKSTSTSKVSPFMFCKRAGYKYTYVRERLLHVCNKAHNCVRCPWVDRRVAHRQFQPFLIGLEGLLLRAATASC